MCFVTIKWNNSHELPIIFDVCAVVMMESKIDDDGDGDGVQPVVVLQWSCRVETMPASFWFKVVMFLAWSDASAMHATSKAVRDHTVGEWQRIELSCKGLRGAWHPAPYFAMFRCS